MPIGPVRGNRVNPIPQNNNDKERVLQEINTVIKLLQEYESTKDPKLLKKMDSLMMKIQLYYSHMDKYSKDAFDDADTMLLYIEEDVQTPFNKAEKMQNDLQLIYDNISNT